MLVCTVGLVRLLVELPLLFGTDPFFRYLDAFFQARFILVNDNSGASMFKTIAIPFDDTSLHCEIFQSCDSLSPAMGQQIRK